MKFLILPISLVFLVMVQSFSQVPTSRDTTGIFIDSRDDQSYKWVKIGSQTWMAENLKFKADSGAVCPDNNLVNCDYYGVLYSWEVAQLACPKGWSLPSDEQWGIFERELGMEPSEVFTPGGRGGDIALQLKSKFGWSAKGSNTDKYGFGILPAGSHRGNSFILFGSATSFWTSTKQERKNLNQRGWYRLIHSSDNEIHRYHSSQDLFMSVRCIKI